MLNTFLCSPYKYNIKCKFIVHFRKNRAGFCLGIFCNNKMFILTPMRSRISQYHILQLLLHETLYNLYVIMFSTYM